MDFEVSPGSKVEIKVTSPGSKVPRIINLTVGDNFAVKVDSTDKNIRFKPLDDRHREKDR